MRRVRGEARRETRHVVSELVEVRRRLGLGERAFAVHADTVFDRRTGEWSARLLFVPLDRSLPRTVASAALKRGLRRDEVMRGVADASDAELARAFRAIALPLPRRPRAR